MPKVGRTVVDGADLRSLLVKMLRAMSAPDLASIIVEAYGPVKATTVAAELHLEMRRIRAELAKQAGGKPCGDCGAYGCPNGGTD